MKRFNIFFISLGLFACLCFSAMPALAFGQDHTCQGSNNCNTENVTTNNNAAATGGEGGSASANGVFSQGQGQDQEQGQFQGQGQKQGQSSVNLNGQGQTAHNSGVNTDVSFDQNVRHEAPDLSKAPGNPASVYVDACSNGLSGSGPGYGFTIGANDPFCKYMALSNTAFQQGDFDSAAEYRETAESTLRRQTFLTRFFDWIPIVGRLF